MTLPLLVHERPSRTVPQRPRADLEFTVPGAPQGARRVRAFVRGKHAAVHPDDRHIQAEAYIRVAAVQAWQGRPALDCAVELVVTCWWSRPARLRRKRDRGDGPLPYTGKPDADNVAKLVMDAMTKAGVWRDDTRVSDLVVRRRYLGLDADGNDVGVERVDVKLYAGAPGKEAK